MAQLEGYRTRPPEPKGYKGRIRPPASTTRSKQLIQEPMDPVDDRPLSDTEENIELKPGMCTPTGKQDLPVTLAEAAFRAKQQVEQSTTSDEITEKI